MPIYEFLCKECEHIWEDWFTSYDTLEIPEKCVNCETAGKVIKIPSLCAGTVKLQGRELTEHIKEERKKIKHEVKKNEDLRANLVGETKFNEILNNNKKINDSYK